MRRWLFLVGAITTEVCATLALKAALDTPAWYIVVVVGYVAAFAFLTVCLRQGMSISVAYGTWGAGGVTATAVLAAFLFNEALTWLMGLGMMIIIAGVITVELGSHPVRRQQEVDEKA